MYFGRSLGISRAIVNFALSLSLYALLILVVVQELGFLLSQSLHR